MCYASMSDTTTPTTLADLRDKGIFTTHILPWLDIQSILGYLYAMDQPPQELIHDVVCKFVNHGVQSVALRSQKHAKICMGTPGSISALLGSELYDLRKTVQMRDSLRTFVYQTRIQYVRSGAGFDGQVPYYTQTGVLQVGLDMDAEDNIQFISDGVEMPTQPENDSPVRRTWFGMTLSVLSGTTLQQTTLPSPSLMRNPHRQAMMPLQDLQDLATNTVMLDDILPHLIRRRQAIVQAPRESDDDDEGWA